MSGTANRSDRRLRNVCATAIARAHGMADCMFDSTIATKLKSGGRNPASSVSTALATAPWRRAEYANKEKINQ
jgi:hypothetical protein